MKNKKQPKTVRADASPQKTHHREGSKSSEKSTEVCKEKDPVCLDDAGLGEHYGHRHGDVDIERL